MKPTDQETHRVDRVDRLSSCHREHKYSPAHSTVCQILLCRIVRISSLDCAEEVARSDFGEKQLRRDGAEDLVISSRRRGGSLTNTYIADRKDGAHPVEFVAIQTQLLLHARRIRICVV